MPDRLYQSSYAGGEIAPDCWARTDLAKFSVSARVLQNFIVHPQGGVSNRPGLSFIEETKDSTKRSRLIDFEAENNDTYILEFGDLYMRVFRNGARVYNHVDDTIYEIVTPYVEADLDLIKYEQSNDVLTLTHPNYAPRELSRFDHDNWTLTTIDFQPGIAAPTGVTATATVGETPSGYTAKNHIYKVSSVSAETGEESLPSAATAAVSNDVQISRKNFNIISWTADPNASDYVVYKNDNGLYGFLGRTIDTAFRDDNIADDLTNSPQKGTNPFDGANKYPRTVSFHEQRRVFGGSNTKPQNVWMTQSSNYKNMGVSAPAKDNEAVTFGIAARSKQKILHIVSLQDMIVFTPSTEWKVSGSDQTGIITPSSILLRPQSYYGSSEVRPIVIGDQILFVSANGKTVRDIGFVFEQNKYVSNDLTVLASHLFDTRSVAGWAFAQSPHSLVNTYYDDGSWACLTYMREHEVWAWCSQKTDGYIESTATVPEFNENVTYFIVRRFVDGAWRRYIERQGSRLFSDVRDAFFVDSGLSLDTAIVMEGVTLDEEAEFIFTDHGFTDGQTVEVSSNTGPKGEAINGRYMVDVIDSDTFKLYKEGDDGNVYVNTSQWSVFDFACYVRILVSHLSGLMHLRGRQVVGLVDGNVIGDMGDLTVAMDGTLDIPDAGGRIHIGLPYEALFETLDLSAGQQVIQGVLKNVGPVELYVKDSRGIEVGIAFDDNMREYKPREFEDYEDPAELITGVVEVTPEPEWNSGGQICVRQKYPLPCTLLATIPNVELAA